MNTNQQNIIKNLDFALRAHKPKSVIIVSDQAKEGKSTFICEYVPYLCDLYDRRILVFDCQTERKDILENTMISSHADPQFIHKTTTKGLDYIHVNDLFFLETLPQPSGISSLTAFFNKISRNYDSVFINIKTLKKADKTVFPGLPIDAAIVVRSKKTLFKKARPVTDELKSRDIPILGLVMNGGL